MEADRFATLPPSAFVRLRALLEGRAAGAPALDCTVGEPQHPFPDFIARVLEENIAGYGKYPPPAGPPELRAAIADWIARRYAPDAGTLDPETQVLAVNGTREALFNACLALCPTEKARIRPLVLIPNPFYQSYAAGAAAAGAEAYFWNATAETGHLPDLDEITDAMWERVGAVYLCSPANPQGAAADKSYLQKLLGLARQHDAIIFADECYSEIYTGNAPTGIAEVTGGDYKNVLIFNSLSKRSNLPGLRQGFVAGDETLIARLWKLRSLGGAPTPLPLCAAANACWRDETHVEANRTLYAEKFDDADAAIGNRFDYKRPAGGIFLWLDTVAEWNMDGEKAAIRLWEDAGLRVLPGAYLSRDTANGNPGTDYIRIAMVYDRDTTKDMLDRLTSLSTKEPHHG
jgi:aspartate/methionine/tyrosine aminotransferase